MSGDTPDRRRFRREGEEARRTALIGAVLDCVAEGGPQAATTRAIARRAGVTQGLIRHYFDTKEALVGAAFEALMTQLTEASSARMQMAAPDDPVARLRAFVAGSLSAPVVDGRALVLWAGFMQAVPRDATMRAVHRRCYMDFRDRLEALIGAVLAARGGGQEGADAATLRRHAIACNAVLDGLWLEGGLLPEAFEAGELARIGLAAVGALLGVDLEDDAEGACDTRQ